MAVTSETPHLRALDIVDGFALLLSVYWAFFVQYAPKAKRTCLLLEMLLGLKRRALVHTVVKATTKITK